MVKALLAFFLIVSLSYADETVLDDAQIRAQLTKKIKSFLNVSKYQRNKKFIEIIFSPTSNFYKNGHIDVVKVVETLKENGLLELFFDNPRELKLNFKTFGSPLFFVKLMSDSLRNIGYYRYITTDSTFTGLDFSWSISLRSEYATDPLMLQRELNKVGCKIVDIEKISSTEWSYVVNMIDAFLNVPILETQNRLNLKRSLYAHWLNVSNIENLVISSSRRNNWYPYISYYDSSLKLIEVIKRDKRIKKITLPIPKFTKYIKISDIYTLKNLKDELIIYSK
ncbi:MAG: hypothetical protein U9P38_02015 [Campylobacterota bacterium]|nr:hypothetical protein [Campylobacterota bacterium]